MGQYSGDGSGVLVDRFHEKNVYWVGVRDVQVLGMVAVNDQPPFSIEGRLPDRTALNALGDRLLEVRLLALDGASRHRLVLAGILWEILSYARGRNYSHLIISGIGEKIAMYERMGFRAIGPSVPGGAARFVPMALPLSEIPSRLLQNANAYSARRDRLGRQDGISLMPGPVEIAGPIRQAWLRKSISHRSVELTSAFENVRHKLSILGGDREVAILAGRGTSANDAVALHLAAAFPGQSGLVLINGKLENAWPVKLDRQGFGARNYAGGGATLGIWTRSPPPCAIDQSGSGRFISRPAPAFSIALTN